MPNKPCPKCRELGKDSTGDHLYLMSDGRTWCCRFNLKYHPPYFERDGEEHTPENTVKKFHIDSILNLPFSSLEDRKLNKSTCEKFGIRVGFDECTGQISEHYYPGYVDGVITGFKQRTLPKKFRWLGKSGKELFGQSVFPAGGKKVMICGGELDAPSAYQMISKKYPDMSIAFVSPTDGENLSSIKNNKDYLNSFGEIYVATDQDKVGQALAADVVALFGPEKVKTMKFSEKDVNKMLVEGKEKEFISSFFSAEKYKPQGIVLAKDVKEEAIRPVEWGLDYPFPSLTQITYGLKTQSVIGIGAGPGAGKTSFIQQIISHLIYHHHQKVAIFSLEENPSFTVKKLAGSILHKPIHLPDCAYNEAEVDKVISSFGDSVYLFDYNDYQEWKDIISAIRFFRQEGVRFFIIDPVSALHAHMDASEANRFLGEMMVDLFKLAKTLDVTFFHINHLNNPPTGKDHGAGGRVTGGQFSGSRAMWKFSTDLWGLERNQLAEEEEEKNRLRVQMIKNRLSGNTSSFWLRFDKKEGVLKEDLDFE